MTTSVTDTAVSPASGVPAGRSVSGVAEDDASMSVHEDRARSTEAGTAAELRPVQAENVPENPQQRRRGVPVVDLEVRAVHRQSHANRSSLPSDGHEEVTRWTRMRPPGRAWPQGNSLVLLSTPT